MNVIRVTRQQICDFFTVKERTLNDWREKGLNVALIEKIGRINYYDLKKVYEWTRANLESSKSSVLNDGTDNELRQVERKLKIGILELRYKKEKDLYFEKKEVFGEWIVRYITIVSRLYELPTVLPTLLFNKTIIEIREEIEEKVTAIIKALAAGGRFIINSNLTEEEKEIFIKYIDEIKK